MNIAKYIVLGSVYLIAAAFMVIGLAGCDLDDDCPVDCTVKVTDSRGNVLECECPNL